MAMVGAFDVHRSQITYRWSNIEAGETRRGRIPALREDVRTFLEPFSDSGADFVLEGTTGWRFVVEELLAAGCVPHLAEPAETAHARGPKRRAKTDRADCDLMVKLLLEDRLTESWIPPAHILEARTLSRLRKSMVDTRIAWTQRIKAQLFHQGLPGSMKIRSKEGRAYLREMEISPAGAWVVRAGLSIIDHLDELVVPLEKELLSFSKAQAGCRALQAELYGVGWLTAAAILTELGDPARFRKASQAVRFSGLDVTVHESDGRRARGHLSHQGSDVLRWALYESATCATRSRSPDHGRYLELTKRLEHKEACCQLARRLCRRAYHLLRELGEEAIAEPRLQRAA